MKTFILGLIVATGLLFSCHAFAETIQVHGIQLEQWIPFDGKFQAVNGGIRKFYDYDNDVVCYTVDQNSISCLHN